jgi:hypothetical protein
VTNYQSLLWDRGGVRHEVRVAVTWEGESPLIEDLVAAALGDALEFTDRDGLVEWSDGDRSVTLAGDVTRETARTVASRAEVPRRGRETDDRDLTTPDDGRGR